MSHPGQTTHAISPSARLGVPTLSPEFLGFSGGTSRRESQGGQRFRLACTPHARSDLTCTRFFEKSVPWHIGKGSHWCLDQTSLGFSTWPTIFKLIMLGQIAIGRIQLRTRYLDVPDILAMLGGYLSPQRWCALRRANHVFGRL